MKISKISFKNIHSLRGEHHIDFLSGPLAEGGLFAITGATGSGKSTLLDVITLALYNRIPRMDAAISKSVIDGEGGIMTRNAQDCYAEVEYIVNGHRYRSHWAIERNRNNNLNDRKQEITDVATGEIIESGKSSVPTKNEALIGLSYDQFIKAMVLSQGEFSKLLKAPRDQRNKLLEDITGAKDYRAIGTAVFRRFKQAFDACRDLNIRLGEIELLDGASEKQLVEDERVLEIKKVSFKENLEALKKQIDHRKSLIKYEKIVDNNTVQQTKLNEALALFTKEEKVLKLHAKYIGHQPLIQQFEQEDKELKKINLELQEHEASAVKLKNDQVQLLKTGSLLVKRELDHDNFSTLLNEYKKTVLALKLEEDLASRDVKMHEERIKTGLREINKNAQRLTFKEDPEEFLKQVINVENRIMAFLDSHDFREVDAIAIREEDINEKLGLIVDLKVALTNYQAELKNSKAKEEEFKRCISAINNHQTQLKKLESELKLLVAEVEQLTNAEENRKKHLSLEEQRKHLVDDEPCPLCGSLDHPYSITHPIYDVNAEVLKSKQEILKTKQELQVATQTNLGNELKNQLRLQSDLDKIRESLKPLSSEVDKLSKALKISNKLEFSEVEALNKSLSAEMKTLSLVKEAFRLKEILDSLKQTTLLWTQTVKLKTDKETARKALYKGNDVDHEVQQLLSKWTTLLESQNNIQKLLKLSVDRKQSVSAKWTSADKELNAVLTKEGIASLSQLKSYILPENGAESIRRKKQDFQIKQEGLTIEKTSANEEIDQLKKLITSTQPLPDMENKHNEMDAELSALNEKSGAIKAQLLANKKAKDKQKDFLNQLKDLKKEEGLWKTMNDLIGDATGKKFSNFVQDLTLQQLIGYTNLRLKDLSDRYILDVPTAEEGDKNDSLKVIDCHQGDARRSINTLSGGETFMVSLAMAFALSDLAAKNVKIESIFIDEGFGTLDPDTLNQAITILEKMQNEGDKSIGIISHVEALKERISTQIRLEKTGSGYSTIEII